jgi:hypothetical protein
VTDILYTHHSLYEIQYLVRFIWSFRVASLYHKVYICTKCDSITIVLKSIASFKFRFPKSLISIVHVILIENLMCLTELSV